MIEELRNRVIRGYMVDKTDAMKLIDAPLDELLAASNEIREKMCGNEFDMCTIVNGKCGKCSEDCKYCAQSAFYHTSCTDSYPLLDTVAIVKEAKRNDERGVYRFSIVTSGRKLSDGEVDKVCESIREIKKQTNIEVCVSFGLLEEEQFRKIKEAGASRVHCNLESSRRFFPEICTTHTYDEKIETLKSAKRAGLSICSGGIIGLGENMEDRIDMVMTARELGVKSVPVNILNPIPGTPFENNKIIRNDELCRIVAIYRFIIPDGNIRLAGGRGLVGDQGAKCFSSGANAAISGDMLTTAGITVETDKALLTDLGFKLKINKRA
ncbi:MAG: biotin synthase BioB [Lachnospiraceae bacterium]|nr:biotin synthase BioB [Lachnospiraceae bacterium]